MLKTIIKKLAGKFIDEAYHNGFDDGWAAAKAKYAKGQFQKGYTPWNKGKKKGVEK